MPMRRLLTLAIFFAGLLSFGTLAENLNLNLALGGKGHGIVHDPDRQLIYVSVPSTNEVIRLSTTDFTIVDRIYVGSQPKGMDLSDDGSRLFIALFGGGAVAVLDLDTLYLSEIVLGTELRHHQTWDVEYVAGERLFVSASPSSSGFAHIVEVKLDQGNLATRVAGDRIIRAQPTFAESPGSYLYIGEGFSPNSLYKLDLNQPGVPIVLEDKHGDISGTSKIVVSPSAARVHTTSGQVIRPESLIPQSLVAAGLTSYVDGDDTRFFVADYGSVHGGQTTTVYSYAVSTFSVTDSWELECPQSFAANPIDFLALGGDGGFLVLLEDKLCGLVSDSGGLDADSDGIIDSSDNCPDIANADQLNTDGDAFGDVCDPYPEDADNLGACVMDNLGFRAYIQDLESEYQQLREEIDLVTYPDSDNDGVPDEWDRCPGTNPGKKVSRFGCTWWQRKVKRSQ
ncbi:MAG: thrombospondin type 3 repeat-containing protein [Pseudomonadota bacterium]